MIASGQHLSIDDADLMAWSYGRRREPMLTFIRNACLDEIGQTDGYDRRDYEKLSDAAVARGVLDARRDSQFRRSSSAA